MDAGVDCRPGPGSRAKNTSGVSHEKTPLTACSGYRPRRTAGNPHTRNLGIARCSAPPGGGIGRPIPRRTPGLSPTTTPAEAASPILKPLSKGKISCACNRTTHPQKRIGPGHIWPQSRAVVPADASKTNRTRVIGARANARSSVSPPPRTQRSARCRSAAERTRTISVPPLRSTTPVAARTPSGAAVSHASDAREACAPTFFSERTNASISAPTPRPRSARTR